MARLVLWCLNRAAAWNPDPLERALRSGGHEVRRGNRTVDREGRHAGFSGWVDDQVLRLGSDEPAHGLMFEGRISEYFVPIVVKCLGDTEHFLQRFGSRLSPKSASRLNTVIRASRLFYGSSAPVPWQRFWDQQRTTNSMVSPHGMGLYEILAEERRTGERAVLVGYSQGGLVAAFLAWLDELFDENDRIIAAVVTVQSPLRGSPFAHPRNANVVAQAILGAGFGAAGYPTVSSHPTDLVFAQLRKSLEELTEGTLQITHGGGSRHFDIDAVTTILDRVLMEPDIPKEQEAWYDALWTGRRWLSGLSLSATPTAFQELSPSDLDQTGSVLNCLAQSPLERTWHGAVVGTNNSLSNLARDVLRSRVPLPRFVVGPVIQWALSQPSIATRLRRVTDPISMRAMNNLARGPEPLRGPLEEGVSQQYLQGYSVRGIDFNEDIPPLAHDFVIPAVSQAFVTTSRCLIGNLLNTNATHMSGAQDGSAGDRPSVQKLLRAIANRLAEAW